MKAIDTLFVYHFGNSTFFSLLGVIAVFSLPLFYIRRQVATFFSICTLTDI